MIVHIDKEIEKILVTHLEPSVIEDDDDDKDNFEGKYSFSLIFYSFVNFLDLNLNIFNNGVVFGLIVFAYFEFFQLFNIVY